MFITSGKYCLYYDNKNNKISIGLPSTMSTAVSTVYPIEDRRQDVSTSELALILQTVMAVFKNEGSHE